MKPQQSRGPGTGGNRIPSPPRLKPRNPLLSLAESSFTLEDITSGPILIPVAPADPVVLQDVSLPSTQPDNFLGHQSQQRASITPVPTYAPPLGHQEQLEPPQPPQPQQQQQQQQQPVQAQASKSSYFTSILSSLPSLSLSAITGEEPKTKPTPPPVDPNPTYAAFAVPAPLPKQQQQQLAAQYGYGYQEVVPNPSVVSAPPLQQLSAPPLQPPPQQSAQPPPTFPPSGGAGSYRLGNQRRLKYAPPPDLTSSTTQSHFQVPTNFPAQPSAPSTIPAFFNPLAAPSPQLGSPTAPLPSGPPSSQGSSLHSSFRSSPVSAAPPSNYGFLPPGPPPPQVSSNFGHSAPQAIPSRLAAEPATPQNTPADAFSGFSTYRQTQPEPNLFGLLGQSVGQLESIQEVGIPPATTDRTFSPISAAKVTERLENLIAAEQSDDSQSVKSELSAEVAKITAGIPEPGKSAQPPVIDDLTEIDLSTSDNSNEVVRSDESSHFDTSVGNDDDLAAVQLIEEPQLIPGPRPLAYLFNKPEKKPSEPVAPPSFFTPSFQPPQQQQQQQQQYQQQQHQYQSQQPFTDPFSFAHSESKRPINEPVQHDINQHPQIKADEPRVEPPSIPFYQTNANLTPSSIWDPINHPQQNQSAPPPNQIYSAPPVQSSPPTFFNPSQFAPPSFPASNPVTSSFAHVPAPVGAFLSSGSNNVSTSSTSSTPSSTQLPSIPQPDSSQFNVVPEPTGSATLSPVQMSVSPLTSRSPQETVPPSLENLAAGLPERQMQYRPVYHHWFYRREVEAKTLWLPFSMHDSLNLEDVHNSNEISPETKVATDGGRYDVEILRRQRSPVYWTGPKTEVRRCSWFYKGSTESRYTPYEESVAARLEEEFKQACTSNVWNRRVELNNGEYIMFHSSSAQAHYLQPTTPELAASWGNNSGSEDNAYMQGSTSRPRIVKRGMDEFNIDEGEPEKIDHILFLVHGIGSVCDLKFRTVEEVVDEFRSIALQLVQSHYRSSSEQGIVNRIEVLPVSWHATLHSGIDKKLQVITLESIPKWRHFTNDTLLDILFYTSPVYCETIMQTVGNELNRLYALFNQRNPEFCGNVYLGGHSLGSLIVFDLLCHQKPEEDELPETNGASTETNDKNHEEGTLIKTVPVLKRKLSKKVSYVMGSAGTGQPFINYPQLAFAPRAFFALGSPIGMFVTVRGIDNLGEDFVLPTCPAFFNIFHPFDPVAYRVESLVYPEAHKYRPMLIPHHKGRKRMHLELKETMARVGADLKQKLIESVRNTWNSVYQLAVFHKQDNQTLEQEIEKVVEEQMSNPREKSEHANNDETGVDLKIGKLNGGRRIDYVLQEAPFEYINEYIFAMTSHVCYWESEDTMLLILKEIYGSMGIATDAQLPQQSLSIERVSTPTMSASSSNAASPTQPAQLYGMDPTSPITSKPVGPPPTTGFVRKS